jgi:Sec-independent protein translocase protein TatA
MRKAGVLSLVLMFLFCLSALPAVAADTATEIEQLKSEMQKLMKKIEDLEKRQSETQTKTVETEKRVDEVAKKAEKVEKKSLRDRLDWGGEIRFRIMTENASTDSGFYGDNQPGKDRKWRDETSFPLRIRLNAHAEIVQNWVDVYARLTMNKRWGAWDTSATDPFNRPNSFESSIGHDMNARFEQAYATVKLPWINSMWYVGRLPGMDGAPQRQARSLFPRLFIDSEIDGTLISWNAPESAIDKVNLSWTSTRLWGTQSEPGKAPTLKTYEAKVNDKTGIILGYIKYAEFKLVDTDTLEENSDADAFIAQAQLKIGKDTEIIWDGLTMADWHMPNTSNVNYVPNVSTNYLLTGAYVDTQLLGFQLYGAYYYSHFDLPGFSFKPGGTGDTVKVDEKGYPGHIWFGGFNTGDLIGPNMQLSVEFADEYQLLRMPDKNLFSCCRRPLKAAFFFYS